MKWNEVIGSSPYISDYSQALINELEHQGPPFSIHDIKPHHDNGKSYVHKDTSNYLESVGLTRIQDPLNLFDLAPSEFSLFRLIKTNLSEQISVFVNLMHS